MTDPVETESVKPDSRRNDDQETPLNTETGVGLGMGEPNTFEPEEHPDSVPDSTTPGD